MATVAASEAASNVLFTETSVKVGSEPSVAFDRDDWVMASGLGYAVPGATIPAGFHLYVRIERGSSDR